MNKEVLVCDICGKMLADNNKKSYLGSLSYDLCFDCKVEVQNFIHLKSISHNNNVDNLDKRRKYKFDNSKIIEMYEAGMSAPKIASVLGCSSQTIYRLLNS